MTHIIADQARRQADACYTERKVRLVYIRMGSLLGVDEGNDILVSLGKELARFIPNMKRLQVQQWGLEVHPGTTELV